MLFRFHNGFTAKKKTPCRKPPPGKRQNHSLYPDWPIAAACRRALDSSSVTRLCVCVSCQAKNSNVKANGQKRMNTGQNYLIFFGALPFLPLFQAHHNLCIFFCPSLVSLLSPPSTKGRRPRRKHQRLRSSRPGWQQHPQP